MINRIRQTLNLKEGGYTGEYIERLERAYELLEKRQKDNEEYINRILKMHAEEVNALAMRNNKLEVALINACDMLETYDLAFQPKRELKTNKQWKAWAMNEGD